MTNPAPPPPTASVSNEPKPVAGGVFYPDRTLCVSCQHQAEFKAHCASLPFGTMTTVRTYADGSHSVLCSAFRRLPEQL